MLRIGKLILGEGMPKICASITEEDRKSVIASADIMVQKRVDLVEWRIDYFKNIENEDVEDILKRIKRSLSGIPLLITYRTSREGGKGDMDVENYRQLLLRFASDSNTDLIDYEVFNNHDFSAELGAFMSEQLVPKDTLDFIAKLKQHVPVVGSYHNFHTSHDKETIIAILSYMDSLGCDILKEALMPKSDKDVLTLMDAVSDFKLTGIQKPVIAMSMGGIGAVSRVIGETFGSDVTFACVGGQSAPGQIEISKLRPLMEALHNFRNQL